MAAIGYADPFVERLCQDVAALVVDGAGDAGELKERAIELALANSPPAAAYWKRTRPGLGIPAEAYKQRQVDLFPDQPVTRVFRSSGTTGSRRSVVRYTKRGAELMRLSVDPQHLPGEDQSARARQQAAARCRRVGAIAPGGAVDLGRARPPAGRRRHRHRHRQRQRQW